MENKPDDLKLIFVLKVGYNTKGEGLYEFIFSKDIESVISMKDEWQWDKLPASTTGNALPPTEQYIDQIYELKTNEFNLECLHENHNHSYLDGIYTIHCLAYETEKEEDYEYDDYEDMYSNNNNDELPLLVFHFGMTLTQVESILYQRDIILHENSFKSSSEIKI